MKKILIVLLAVVAITASCTGVGYAEERAGRFSTNSGLGFMAGQGSESFLWQFGGDYYFTDLVSANLELGILAGDFFFFQFMPRLRLTFDIIENLEGFGDFGFGYFVGDADDWIMAFGGGAHYFFLDGQLGLGSNLDFTVNGITGGRFNIQWAIVNVMYRF